MALLAVIVLTLLSLSMAEEEAKSRDKKMSDPYAFARRRLVQQAAATNKCFGSVSHGEFFILNNNPCIKYGCNNGNPYLQDIKCRDGHNRCHAVGATTRGGFNGCLLMQCKQDGTFEHVQSDPWKCKDINNVCRRPGLDRFPMNLNGFHVNNCWCQIVAGQIKYYCPQGGK